MSKVFLSFLGIGQKDYQTGQYRYLPAEYNLNGRLTRTTEFVQVAELDALGANRYEKVIIVVTSKSRALHYERLKAQLKEIGISNLVEVEISEDMSGQGQWIWFEEILAKIDPGAELTIDLTHGYRVVPIVFSTAINFLRKIKGVSLEAVYYGAFDQEGKPIVDLKDFFNVNEWAEAVSRLVEEADASKLAETAERTPDFQAGVLNDPAIVKAFKELTAAVRNVDINRVGGVARNALSLVRAKEGAASKTGSLLLKLVIEKFATLAVIPSGRYDRPYFLLQLEIIRMLLEHGLYMQGFTVMREFIGSLGMAGLQLERMDSGKGRAKRRYADIFINMVQFERSTWRFNDGQLSIVQELLPRYQRFEETGIINLLQSFTKELIVCRNGFDHAWTQHASVSPEIEAKGRLFLKKLEEVVARAEKSGLLI